MVTVGLDFGSKSAKCVVMSDGSIRATAAGPVNFDTSSMVTLPTQTLMSAGIGAAEIHCVGYMGFAPTDAPEGYVHVSRVQAAVCAARFYFPAARTIVDIGAEQALAVACDESGAILDFAVNERCAAGSGSFLEAMSRALEAPLDTMPELALAARKKIELNTQCAIFAESEVIGLIHEGASKEDIAGAIHDSVAAKAASLVRRVGIHEDVVLLGGLGYNAAFVAALHRELSVKTLHVPSLPDYAMALGAALLCAETPVD